MGRAWMCLVAGALLAGCAARAPRTQVGVLGAGLEAFLAGHRVPADAAIRVDEVARTAGASYHLVQARGSERPHRHAAHDLTVVLLRGRGTLTLDGVALALRAGDVTIVPRGAAHWFASEGRDAAVALVVMSPPQPAAPAGE